MRPPLAPVPLRVRACRQETAEAVTLVLAAGEERTGFGQPGQFNMLAPLGIGEAAISLSGPPTSPDLEHTVRSVGAVSEALRRMRPGDWVGVRGPYGFGWPIDLARGQDVVLVAGGIGLAPLRPAIEMVLDERAAFGRVLLLYGARTPADRLFLADLERWRSRPDVDVAVSVDYAEPGWQGRVGFVTAMLPQLRVDPARTVAFACGPEVMMRAVATALQARGIRKSAIFLSMERNMKCGVGTCGHCQFGPYLVCRDGPVFAYDRLADLLPVREI
ncbi:MAG: FAD/NAD(P)-binding protein [Pseudomonadota bacterium]